MSRRSRGSVGKRPDRPGYWLRWTDHAGKKRKCKARGTTLRDANVHLRELLAEDDKEARQPYAMPTLAGFLVTSYVPDYRKQVGTLTFKRAGPVFRRAGEWFAPKLLSEITRDDVKRYLRWLQEKPDRPLKPASVRREYAVLAPVFDEAVELEFIAKNPFRGSRKRRPKLPKPERRVVPFLPRSEIDRIISLASECYRPFLTVIADTGLRRQQAIDLEWGDVADDFSILQAKAQKRGRRPVVPLTPRLQALLRQLWEERAPAPLRGPHRVFPGISANAVKLMWNRLRRRAGHPTLRLHDWRHLFASHLEELGARPQTVADVLGHRGPKMAIEVYSRSVPDSASHEAIRRLAEAQ